MNKPLLSIQALRAVAAIAVCTVHSQAFYFQITGRPQEPLSLYSLAAGVDLFFVISGFVMVISSEQLFGTKSAWTRFIVRRIARIVPLYWLVTFPMVRLMRNQVTASDVIQSYLFIPFATPNGAMVPIYGVGWTLNFEMFFYAIFAAAIMFRRGLAVALISSFLVALVAAGRLSGLPDVVRFWSDPIVIEFVFGMWLAIAYRRGVQFSWLTSVALCVVGVVAIWFSSAGNPPTSGARVLQWGLPMALLFAGLVLGPISLSAHGLLSRCLLTLGEASYSIYLMHLLVLTGIFFKLMGHGYLKGVNLLLIAVGGVMLVIAVSLATFRLIERPISNLAKRLTTAPRRSQTQSAAHDTLSETAAEQNGAGGGGQAEAMRLSTAASVQK